MTNTALKLYSSGLAVTDGLQAYIQKVNAIPVMSAEEERELAIRFQQEGDLLAAQQLVLSQLRYVVRIARMYTGYGLPITDLIQEGSIGLMKAVKKFDPNMGVRLVSFAVHWIKSEIHEFVIRNWRIVKVATTKAQRKLFFNLRQAKKRLGWFSREEVEAVAQDLGVPPSEVVEMEQRLNAHDASFDYGIDTEGEDALPVSPTYYLAGPQEQEPSAYIQQNWEEETHKEMRKAFESLDERSQIIISERLLNENKASLKDLSEKYGISIERVRQIEKNALLKLRKEMESIQTTEFA